MSMASIDIGSNTVRLLLADVSDCRIVPFRYDQVITRLARGLSSTGRLSQQSIDETEEVLGSYKAIAREWGASVIVAAGTGALREALNAPEFIQRIREQIGIDIEVLPGLAEAELTALGVASSLSGANNALILDIGGASTEVIAVRKSQKLFRQTIAIGVVKLLEQYVSGDPPDRSDLNSLEEAARAIGDEFLLGVKDHHALHKDMMFISTAGTPTTLAAMDLALKVYDHTRVHGHRISIGKLEKMLEKLASVSAIERVGMGCLELKRADLIIPGLILTIGIMKSFGFHEMTVSDQGLLEGLLLRAAGCGH